MKFLPRLITTVVIAALSLLSQSLPITAQDSVDPNEEAFRHITNRLMCQCGGCSYLVLSCNHVNCSSATYISKSVRSALEDGQTEEMILASLADMYGPQVLAEPPREGFTWLGWIMPYIGLLLGGGAVALVIWRWRKPARRQPGTGGGTPAPLTEHSGKLVDRYRDEIDRELAKD
jgi:cytochrome c-type biogenesis protein CcmH